mmetsp:Transcript_26411/g.40320  ORF Transcript_26411/g.40320 Transcript_26411/m.40320 type:complete len:90 (+) Transcript_26411:1853-2122(+)
MMIIDQNQDKRYDLSVFPFQKQGLALSPSSASTSHRRGNKFARIKQYTTMVTNMVKSYHKEVNSSFIRDKMTQSRPRVPKRYTDRRPTI